MHKSVHHVQPSGCVGPLLDSLPGALAPPGQGIPIRALEYNFTVTVPRELGPGEPASMHGAVMGPHRTAQRGLIADSK
jgi:hypothetical protein